jgi:hypothetical protein
MLPMWLRSGTLLSHARFPDAGFVMAVCVVRWQPAARASSG